MLSVAEGGDLSEVKLALDGGEVREVRGRVAVAGGGKWCGG